MRLAVVTNCEHIERGGDVTDGLANKRKHETEISFRGRSTENIPVRTLHQFVDLVSAGQRGAVIIHTAGKIHTAVLSVTFILSTPNCLYLVVPRCKGVSINCFIIVLDSSFSSYMNIPSYKPHKQTQITLK